MPEKEVVKNEKGYKMKKNARANKELGLAGPEEDHDSRRPANDSDLMWAWGRAVKRPGGSEELHWQVDVGGPRAGAAPRY